MDCDVNHLSYFSDWMSHSDSNWYEINIKNNKNQFFFFFFIVQLTISYQPIQYKISK